ncbi:MAG: hypothetical protein JWO60_2701 [Frankiales bacterium]|nr:hypothetical protein [Frankiales bacterium]
MTADDAQVPVTDDLVIDLLDDPREVAGVLGFGYPQVPLARRAEPDLAVAAARLDGYGEYGS